MTTAPTTSANSPASTNKHLLQEPISMNVLNEGILGEIFSYFILNELNNSVRIVSNTF